MCIPQGLGTFENGSKENFVLVTGPWYRAGKLIMLHQHRFEFADTFSLMPFKNTSTQISRMNLVADDFLFNVPSQLDSF